MPFSDIQLRLMRDYVVLDLEALRPQWGPDRETLMETFIIMEPQEIPAEKLREAAQLVAGIEAGKLSKRHLAQVRGWLQTHGPLRLLRPDELPEAMKNAGDRKRLADYYSRPFSTRERHLPFFLDILMPAQDREKVYAAIMEDSKGDAPPQPISCLQRAFAHYVTMGDYGRAQKAAIYLVQLARELKQHQLEYEIYTTLLELGRQGRYDLKYWQYLLGSETADTADINAYLKISQGEALIRIGPKNREEGARLIVETLIQSLSGKELASRLEEADVEYNDYLARQSIFNEAARQVEKVDPKSAKTFKKRADGEMAFYQFLASLDLADPVTRPDLPMIMMERLARDTSGKYDILLFELQQVWERILRHSAYWNSGWTLFHLAEIRFGASVWDRKVSVGNYLLKKLSTTPDGYDDLVDSIWSINQEMEKFRKEKKTGRAGGKGGLKAFLPLMAGLSGPVENHQPVAFHDDNRIEANQYFIPQSETGIASARLGPVTVTKAENAGLGFWNTNAWGAEMTVGGIQTIAPSPVYNLNPLALAGMSAYFGATTAPVNLCVIAVPLPVLA